MATVSAKILKHHKKADGTYNVKICIAHKNERVFLDTEHYVKDKQLTKDRTVKDQFILSCVNKTLDAYRRLISDNEEMISNLTAANIKEFFIRRDLKIDFLLFCKTYIETLKSEKRAKGAANFNTVCNHLCDFIGHGNPLAIELITVDFLTRFEKFLRNERTMLRIDRIGKEYKTKGKPLGDASIHVYLRDFSGLFSAAVEHYNKPSIGIVPIKHNPFKEFHIVDAPETTKRNIQVDQIKVIAVADVRSGSRCEMAKELFMLSFYLCGINAIDLYKANYIVRNGRIEYNRSKTAERRKDNAFISIKVPPEARPILKKYQGVLSDRYASIGNLNKALSTGMRELKSLTGISSVTFYSARHTFGSLARNSCRLSKDDIALALNHVDNGHKTTDIYLAKDWSIVDEVQESVLNLLRDKSTKKVCRVTPIINLLLAQCELPRLL